MNDDDIGLKGINSRREHKIERAAAKRRIPFAGIR